MDLDEPLLCRFGTPLEPLEEDEVPSKKPVAIEDQIVTDENGRRRFHGAFTGGFSAGFWNTVGSLEGWKPQNFKSSRSEKAEKRQQQKPTDFMDDEDLGEFGIAPQRIQAREDFSKDDSSSSRLKRKFPAKEASGAIPGIPVLQLLLEPAKDKIAVRLLKRMGWKPNQGIGARQTKVEKKRSKQQNAREMYVMKMYGCAPESNDDHMDSSSALNSDGSEKDDDEDMDELTFAPDDYEPFVCSVKDNKFGLGYSGLSRQITGETKSHINLFGPLEVLGKDNKKLSIRGQAFGVGALEEEDEDIYAKDDMSQYDFSLGDKNKRKRAKIHKNQDLGVLEGFTESSLNSEVKKKTYVVEIKANFKPRNWLQRKSRFDPLPEDKLSLLIQKEDIRRKGLGRHDLNPIDRRNIFEGTAKTNTDSYESNEAKTTESSNKSYLHEINDKYKKRENKTKKLLELLSSKEDSFVKGGLITNEGIEQTQTTETNETVNSETKKIQEEAKRITKSLDNKPEVFRPFASNTAKQERYEKFIDANLHKDEDIKTFLSTIQPLHLSEWDREMELKEFIQARNIYKPLNGMMSERFVSKSIEEIKLTPTTKVDEKIKVVVKRTKVIWKPCSLICKRFNIPEPFGGTLVEPKVPKKNKFSVFDYIENSINSKKDFVTPVIIPKHIEKPQVKQTQMLSQEVKISSIALSEKNIAPSLKATSEKDSSGIEEFSKKPLLEPKKPKTDLERKIEESKNKHPSEKKDLFKSIFDSSSEDEDEDGNNEIRDEGNVIASATKVIPTDIVDSLVKPSVPINILRNNSPPRGIFAALLKKPELESKPEPEPEPEPYVVKKDPIKEGNTDKREEIDKITFKPKKERSNSETNPEVRNTYGPKLPDNLLNNKTQETTKSESEVDKRLVELLSLKSIKSARVVEKWVEKEKSPSKKSKNKKDKKKKDKKKKDEYKHKKTKKHKKEKK